MCIVADSVNDVSKTKIASFHTGYALDGGQTVIPAQLIVYSANVDSAANTNAFILPVYNPGNDYRKIIPLDFSGLPDFFSDVENIFERWFPKLRSRSLGMTNSANYSLQSDSILVVHKVGDYKFSIMPSKMDFNRLDRSQLNINPMAKTAIDVHSDDYSFIVYQFFQKGQIEITPFGYLCEPCREHAMILPTIHGHPHDGTPTDGLGYVPNMYVSYKSDFEDQAEFDHEIYGLVKSPATNNSVITKTDIVDIDRLLKQISKDYMNRKIRIYSPRSFVPKKINFKGYKDNRNLLIKLDGHLFVKDLTIDRNYNDNTKSSMDRNYNENLKM